VQAWTTELEFAYDFGHVYLLDGCGHWSTDERVDLRMPRNEGFFVPLRIECWGARPAPDLDGWDCVSEFSLRVDSGKLALASGGCGALTVEIAPGSYRARWSGRNLAAAGDERPDGERSPDSYRLQLWPGAAAAPRAEVKRYNGHGSDLGDLPALLADEGVQAVGSVTGAQVNGASLTINVHLAAWAMRSWERTIRCDGVVRWLVTGEPFGHARLHAEHPGLLPFADERGGLSFRGRPREPERLAHALRAAHAESAGPHIAFEEGLAERLAVGYGRLASGPVTLLRRYASVAGGHGVATNLTITGPGRTDLSLLELGDSYVVAERFTA
jgi:hypothetical protein